MRINGIFNIKRFYLLVKRDFYTQAKTNIIGLGAIFCILFIINIASIASYKYWNFNLVFYPLSLFIGGFIFTSVSFSELGQEQSGISYLILPGSSFEKFLSKLVITNIGYVLVSLLLYFFLSIIAFFINTLIFGIAHQIFNPFNSIIWICIRIYLITQSVFLLGAVYFKKSAFIKTILSLFGLFLAYTLFVCAILFIMYFVFSFNKHIYFSSSFFENIGENGGSFPPVITIISGILFYVIRILFWFVLAPLFWIISYLHLKETEV